MKTSIFSRIFLVIIFVAFVSTAIATVFTVRDQTLIFREGLRQEKATLLEFIASDLKGGTPEEITVSSLEKIGEFSEVEFFWMVEPNGEVFYADDPGTAGKISNDPFVELEKRDARRAIYDKKEVMVVGQPVELEGYDKPWTIIVGVSLADYNAFLPPALMRGLLILIGATLVAVYLSLFFTNKIVKPLMKLEGMIKEIGEGNFDQEINLKTGDEIEIIGEEFNKMTKKLAKSQKKLEENKKALEVRVKARTRELEKLKETLEEKVEARTEQLQRKVEELEKFHELTVGREKKMIELKEKNEELRKKIEKLKEEKNDQTE